VFSILQNLHDILQLTCKHYSHFIHTIHTHNFRRKTGMPITERKALAMMFDDLQTEKRQLKKEYREDMATIEKRIDHVLERLGRLDDLEREAIDAEGCLRDLAETAKKLGELIPQVSAADVINKAAAEMAAAATESGVQINEDQNSQPAKFSTVEQQEHFINERDSQEKLKTFNTETGVKPQSIKDTLEKIEQILKYDGGLMNSRQIEAQLKKMYGWEWKEFPVSFSGWRNEHSTHIKKIGRKYKYDSMPQHPTPKKKAKKKEIESEEAAEWIKQPTTEKDDNLKTLN
jgi:hypothetical protein